MAWQTSKRVWDHTKEIKESDKVMLLALADKADELGICWPKFDTSYETLSSMVGINRRSAIRIIERLEEWGHVYVDVHAVGRGNSNLFLVTSGLPHSEIEALLINHFGKEPGEAELCATSLISKQDSHRNSVMSNTKKFPKKRKKGVTSSANGVTENTFYEPEKGVTGDKKVLPVTKKGVIGNTQPMSPSDSLTPNGVGGKPPKVEDADRTTPLWQLMNEFVKQTGIQMPHNTSRKKDWWAAIRELYEIANRDVDVGKRLIRDAIEEARQNNWTVTRPGSLVNTAGKLMAQPKQKVKITAL